MRYLSFQRISFFRNIWRRFAGGAECALESDTKRCRITVKRRIRKGRHTLFFELP